MLVLHLSPGFFRPLRPGLETAPLAAQPLHLALDHPLIAIALLLADYAYFWALRQPDSLVALVMSLRRASTLVAFADSLLFFGELNGWRKLPAVIGILIGIILTILGQSHR